MNYSLSFQDSLHRWLAIRSLNRKPRTVEFYADVVDIILKAWPEHDMASDTMTEAQVLPCAKVLERHRPSRWNTMVAALRFVTPHGKVLACKRINIRRFTPPTHEQFASLLAQCDGMRRTKAGLVVRFLSYTGLRLSEARALTWWMSIRGKWRRRWCSKKLRG